jgi:hypothetical protein
MATRYVSALAAGGGSGTFASPWTLAEGAANYTTGDEIRIMADGFYDLGAGITFAKGSGQTTRLYGANSSGTVDGTRPVFRATAGSITLLTCSANWHDAKYLSFDANGQTTVSGLLMSGAVVSIRYCDADGFDGIGLRSGGSQAYIEFCYATGCGVGLKCDSGNVFGSRASGNTTGIECQHADRSIADGNSGDGFNTTGASGSPPVLTHCVAHDNGGDGIDGNGNQVNVLHSILTENGGYGVNGSASGATRLTNCAGRNNTSGLSNATHADYVVGSIALTADPFTDVAGGDFSLNNDAGGGALCKAAAVNVHGQTGYLDVGAVQSAGSGGGGGGRASTRLRTML